MLVVGVCRRRLQRDRNGWTVDDGVAAAAPRGDEHAEQCTPSWPMSI